MAVVALVGGWSVHSIAAFHLEKLNCELNCAIRNGGIRDGFPRMGHVSSVKPDHPANSMGKAKSSGANLLSLCPPFLPLMKQ